ncbi:hypothetical protein [Poseidonocella sp. HB161398]|uniref:oxidoreductase n=1 Tax=Poseidonocella sp. HB161398 TaxID=2320855 RepID=UPI001F0D0E5D|nr:hypothetical protein [Poseidonocella sp. HB161398]
MEEADIARVIAQFAETAALSEAAGFDGVQFHAAHGCPAGQVLSPLANRRTDRWGGVPENRARPLTAILRAVRARVPPEFGVGAKLNSAGLQTGGFAPEEAVAVVRTLDAEAADPVEISGGSDESPARVGTRAREACFVEFARDIPAVAGMPVMVPGGIRRLATALPAPGGQGGRPGVAMIGMALARVPDLPARWQEREAAVDLAVPRWPGGPRWAWSRRRCAGWGGDGRRGRASGRHGGWPATISGPAGAAAPTAPGCARGALRPPRRAR